MNTPASWGETPEVALLLACARRRLGAAEAGRVRALLRTELSWDAVLALAGQHRLLPLLAWHLGSLDSDAIPPSARGALAEALAANVKQSLLLTAELKGIFDLLGGEGIPVLPYKGPVLAQQLYGNVALRQMADLDLVVGPRSLGRALELLRQRGYVAIEDSDGARGRALRRADSNLVLFHPAIGVTLELHWAFGAGRFSYPADLDALERELEWVTVAGATLPALGRSTLLVVLCFHGSKHMWERLEWIAGVGEVMRGGGLDWDRVLGTADQLGNRRALLLGLSLAHRLLDVPLPGGVAQQIEASPAVDSLTERVRRRLFAGSGELAHSLGLSFHLFQLRSKERLRDKLRYLYYCAAAPSKEDWAAVPLPDPLFPLYFLIRPFRLAGEYGLRVARSRR